MLVCFSMQHFTEIRQLSAEQWPKEQFLKWQVSAIFSFWHQVPNLLFCTKFYQNWMVFTMQCIDLATEVELNNGQVKDAFAHLCRLRSACPRISSPTFLPDGTLCLINHRSYNAGETTTPNYSIGPSHLCLLNYKTQLPVQFLMTR